MRKRSERTLKELYDITEKIAEPEITPVLEGNCRIQGPVDESDLELRMTKSGTFPSEKRFMFVNKSLHMRVESGTCNVCSAPCSCCMHNNRTVSAMESKIECGSSQNSSATKDADSCSFICADGMPLYKSRICDDSQRTTSEASNLLSASSSHDSYSENAESKATVRAFVTGEESEDVDMPPFVLLRETIEDQFLQEKRDVMGDCLFSSNSYITSDLCLRTSSERDDEQRGLECHGNNISSITGIKNSNIKVGHHNIDLDEENATGISVLADSLLSRETENTVQVEGTGCLHGSENKAKRSYFKRQITCPKESFQKRADYANAAAVHVSKHNSSSKIQSPCSPSQDGYISCHNADFKDSDGSSSCQLRVDGESSIGPQPQLAEVSIDEKKPPSNHENKEGYTGNSFSVDAVKIIDPCLENENGLDKGISCDEVIKSSTIKEEFEMPSSLVEASNMQEPQQVMEGGNSESETELLDVKVCDICGDAGREELLAFCGRCSDGAEHIYCMREKLRKVPEGDWLCEECQLKEDVERQKVDRPEKVSEAAKECKVMEDGEVKKVDKSEKVSATAKESKLKEHSDVKKGNRSEVVPGTARECKVKEDGEVEKVDKSEKVSARAKESKLKEYSEVKKGNRSEVVHGTSRECKVKEDGEVEKVNKSEKVSATAKESKLKEYSEVKKGNRSEVVPGTSRECKQEDSESKRVEEAVPGISKLTHLNETSQNFASTSNLKLMPKLDMKAVGPDIRKVPKGLKSPKISAKRHAESQEVILLNTKKPPEINGECIEMGSPRKKTALSRESSFKNLYTGKARVADIPPSNGGQSANSSKGFFRSQSMLGSHSSKVPAQLQPPCGLLSQSSSFNLNSKSKVKLLTERVPVKPKITRKSSLNDTRKVALVRAKSLSFKNMNSPDNTDPTSKTQGIHQSRVEYPKSLKQVNGNNMIEKKISSMLDCPPTNLSPMDGTSIPISRMDVKTAPRDVNLNNMSESNILSTHKGSDDVNGLGRKEAKKQSTYSSKILGTGSLNAKVNCEDQRPSQTPKECAYGSSNPTDKLYNNAETVQQRAMLQTEELTHQNDKTKDPSIYSGSRQAVSGGNQILHYQRCNEMGHATQFCSIDKLQSSALKPSAEKNSKDVNKIVSKWKDAVQTTIIKSRLQKITRQSDQSEDFPISTAVSCEIASKDFLSSSTNHPRNIPLVVGTSDGQEISRSSEVDPIKTALVTDVRLQSCLPVEASCTSRSAQTIESSCTAEARDLNANDAVLDELYMKHLLRMLPDQASVLANPYRTSAIPELEFIWQGSLEVLKTGNEPAPFDGIQAHLSMSASPKVLEVATKLPCRVQLEEVSCFSSWPLQSQGICPNEHNIALFFFAKDVESYERSYSKLLEKMLKNDLALRGIIDGVELLIFPSTKLPVHSQRWNRLFFLWGIFKGRRTESLTSKLSSHKKPSGPNLNIDPASQDLPYALRSLVSDSQKAVSVENPKKSPRRGLSPKSQAVKPTTFMETLTISSPKVEGRMCRAQDSPLVHNSSLQSASYNRLQLEQSSSSFPVSHSLSSTNQPSILVNTHPESRFRITNTPPCSEVENDYTYLGKHVVTPSAHGPTAKEHIGFSRASPLYSTPSDCKKGTDRESSRSEKGPREKEISKENVAVVYDDPRGNLTGIDHLIREERPNRKRARSCSAEALSPASAETTKSPAEIMLLKHEVNYLPMCVPADYEREQKRMCSSDGHAPSSFRGKISSARLSSQVQPLLTTFLNEQHRESTDGDCNEAVIPENSRRQVERLFFPVEPSPVQHTKSDKLIHIHSSDDEDDQESNTPNLELALWARRKPLKEQQRKGPAEDDDDVSASLSLSLAIPTPKKECPKPILKSEQHLQDRPDVNTALLLFGGFTGT